MSIQLDFSGKVVLITGVARGIGLSIARMFLRAGASIIGTDLHAKEDPALDDYFKLLDESKGNHTYLQADLSKKTEIEKLVNAIADTTDGIDALISNAGVNIFVGAAEENGDGWQENLNINLTSHWLLAKNAKRLLFNRKGVLIIMSSNHAYQTIPGCFPYPVAKTALVGLVRSLALEWSPEIRTVGLAPGFIDTPGNQNWFNGFTDPEAERNRTIELHPVKELGNPDDIGAWCVFLASSYARFASGVVFLIDGGRNALLQDTI